MRGLNLKKSESNSSKNNQDNIERKPNQLSHITTKLQKNTENLPLEEQHKHLREKLAQKQAQFISKEKAYRIEIFRNNKIKGEIQLVDKEFEFQKYKITVDLLQKNKNNKESPLFYNQNGLSPLELTLIEEKKYEGEYGESLICMICFQDIEKNQDVITLPCQQNFHKDCIIQHLLGSRLCPDCNQSIDLVEHIKKKLVKMEKQKSNYLN